MRFEMLAAILTMNAMLLCSCNGPEFKATAAADQPQEKNTATAENAVAQPIPVVADEMSSAQPSPMPAPAPENKPSGGVQDLIGLWDARGYTCVDAKGTLADVPLEVLKLELLDGKFLAIKVQGDDCVSAGLPSFEGTRNGDKLELQFYVGSPGQKPFLSPTSVSGVYTPTRIEIQSTPKPIILTPRKQ